jgi:hypothetical protein
MVTFVNTDKNGWTTNTVIFLVIPMKEITVWDDLGFVKSAGEGGGEAQHL